MYSPIYTGSFNLDPNPDTNQWCVNSTLDMTSNPLLIHLLKQARSYNPDLTVCTQSGLGLSGFESGLKCNV